MAGFRRQFNGEAPKKVKKGTFKRLIKNILERKKRLVFIAIGLVGSTIASVATNLFIQILIDDYIEPMLLQTNPNFEPLIKAILTFISIVAVGIVCSLMFHLLMVKLSNGILMDIRQQMYQKMQSFPIAYFDSNNAGDIMSKYTNDLDTLRQVIAQAIPQTVMGIFGFIFSFICMLKLSANLFVVVIIMCVVMVKFTRWSAGFALTNYRETQKSVGDLNAYVEEMVLGAKEVKVYNYEDRNIDIFNEKNERWKNAIIKADIVSTSMMPVMNGLGNVMYILIAFVGGMMMLYNVPNYSFAGKGLITIGAISSFLSFTKVFAHTIGNLSSQLPFIMQSLSGLERIYALIDNESEVDKGTKELSGVAGNIILENVNFSYVKDKPVLKDINVYAYKGQKVALVGATGAGKTTITNLINRFYEIDSGIITYDGVNISDIKKKSLRDNIALVLQDVQLFTGTIMDNIRYGKLDATDAECINAAKIACADQFITMLPDGYDTVIKGDGGGLSQGQKQLISIARAQVANPPVMILDEATSSIDTRTEKLVKKGMDAIMKGKTVFLIAHRLSTIKDCDVIMVMQNGEIIERGTHESLLAKKGHYYELYTGKVEID